MQLLLHFPKVGGILQAFKLTYTWDTRGHMEMGLPLTGPSEVKTDCGGEVGIQTFSDYITDFLTLLNNILHIFLFMQMFAPCLALH